MEKVKLYQIKKGGFFKMIDHWTGEPTSNIYIKGRPHTDKWDFGDKTMYVVLIHAPGEPYDKSFCGYWDPETEVFRVDTPKLQL